MKKYSLVLVVSLILVLCGAAFAADDNSVNPAGGGVIEGVVYHEEGPFIPDANVVLDEGAERVKTGLDGRFRIEDVAPGRHNLLCWKEGYSDLGKEVTVISGRTTLVDFPLFKRVGRRGK